ncbi:MAG: CoA-transferase [Alphaproteobacteria bacterium]|nr:CoA-transferase [Alphaproteobacteria bacterium]MDP6516165.1 CoA-transferase [Alphaproteobacteria bacterium]
MAAAEPDYRSAELLIVALARLLAGAGHVVAGAVSPIPAAAALLAAHQAPGRMRVSILGSQDHFPYSDGGREIFDIAGRGRIDVFFLGGGQIDGAANINLVGTGTYPDVDIRFPGSFGSAYMYYMVPKVILFREEHSPRVLVAKVDFISAPGTSPPDVCRPGGPSALLTGKAAFAFDRQRARFRLESVHPGHDLDTIRTDTGFAFDHPPRVAVTAPPSAADLAAIRGPVRESLGATYPEFAARRLGEAA